MEWRHQHDRYTHVNAVPSLTSRFLGYKNEFSIARVSYYQLADSCMSLTPDLKWVNQCTMK